MALAQESGIVVAEPNLGRCVLPDQGLERKIDSHSLRALHEGRAALRVAKDDDLGWPQSLADFCCTRRVIYPRKHVQPTLLDQILEPVHRILSTMGTLHDEQAICGASKRTGGQAGNDCK